MFGLIGTIINQLITRPIVNILFVIYSVVGDFGLAIIIFTIIVKFAMWPLMKRQLHQTKIMRQIQPELAEIKKNCKGNRQLESIQMMDLYKRKNVKPFRSIITLLIQLPIFFSLFTAINIMVRPHIDEKNRSNDYSVEQAAYPFVKPMNHINQLINQQNDYFKELETDKNAKYDFEPKLFNIVNLSMRAGFNSRSGVVILIFALASAAVQFIMSRQQDPTNSKSKKKKRSMRSIIKAAANEEEINQEDINAATQRQMSFMMPIMMLFIMLNLPGALVLYYLLNNIITVGLQKIILNRDLDEMEEAADKRILKELRKVEAKEAEIVADNTKKLNNATQESTETETDNEASVVHTTRIKSKTPKSHFSTSRNKKSKEHITRISSSSKKKRR